MDGIKAAAKIRELPGSQDCVLILVTADLLVSDDSDVTANFNHVVLKPVTLCKIMPLLP